MKFSVSVVATAVFASMAAAAPPHVSSNVTGSEEAGQIAARDSFFNADPDTDNISGESNVQLDEDYYKAQGQAIDEMDRLANDFKKSCDWNWFDMEAFEQYEKQWSSELAEIEKKYKGKLPGQYNMDKEIENLNKQFSAIKQVSSIEKYIGEDDVPGGDQVLAIFEMTAKISSIYYFSGQISEASVGIDKMISDLERELRNHDSIVASTKDMSSNLKDLYEDESKEVKESLAELKRKAQ